jgi:hypothetical protein
MPFNIFVLNNSDLNKKCIASDAQIQGGQMVHFQTKNPNLGKFRRALELKRLVYFGPLEYITAIWYILRLFW